MKTRGALGIILVVSIFGLLCKQKVTAQQVSSELDEDYSRPSVTFFMAKIAGDQYSQKTIDAATKISLSDKYFNHNLDRIHLDLSPGFQSLSFEEKKKTLVEQLNKNSVGSAIIAKWFNRSPEGMFNLSFVYDRGMYNATDQDVLMSNAAKRGEVLLKDAGQNLVNKTYVLILAPREFSWFDNEQSHGWNSMYDVFLFKINFDAEDVERFYSIWPYEDDPPEIKQQKIAAFDTTSFTLRFVYGKQALSSSSTELYALTDNPKSSDQMFNETVAKMYDNALFNIDKDLEAFRVKVSVSGTRPIRAKIGKKEGLKCDQRYFVYEFVWNGETNQAEEDRKAVVRAKGKIVDNRGVATGSSKESEFYQVYGGTVRQGMVMQQRNDLGISLIPGFEMGEIGGGSLGLWIRTGFFTNVPSLYVQGDIGFDSKEYDPYETGPDTYSFFRFSVGLGKGIRMARIVELVPFAGWGMESTSNDSLAVIRTTLIKAGGAMTINITPGVALFGQLNFYVPYDGIEIKEESEDDAVRQEEVWTDRFENRSGMSILAGLRIEF
jgi:hypothetical protein